MASGWGAGVRGFCHACSKELTSSSWEIASDLSAFPLNSLSSGESLTFEGGFDFLEKAKSNLKPCVVNKGDEQFAECDLF